MLFTWYQPPLIFSQTRYRKPTVTRPVEYGDDEVFVVWSTLMANGYAMRQDGEK